MRVWKKEKVVSVSHSMALQCIDICVIVWVMEGLNEVTLQPPGRYHATVRGSQNSSQNK